jgi:hypothetical protein
MSAKITFQKAEPTSERLTYKDLAQGEFFYFVLKPSMLCCKVESTYLSITRDTSPFYTKAGDPRVNDVVRFFGTITINP